MKKLLFLFLILPLFTPHLTLAGANLGQLSLQKTVRNLSDAGDFASTAEVHLGEEVEFKLEIKSANGINIVDAVVSDTFPSHLLEYLPGSLTVNGQNAQTGLTSGGLRFTSITASPTVIMYKAKTIQSGQSQDTASATAQNANPVSSATTLTIPARSHANPNPPTGNTNPNPTPNGTVTNQNLIDELEEHACLHVQNGPDRAISASAQIQGAPDASRSHTRFNISLPNNQNYVAFTPPTSGDYIFLLNQNLPVKITNSSGGEISLMSGSSATCPSAVKKVIAELNNGTYYLQFSGGSGAVNLVVERAEHNIFNPGNVAGTNTFTSPETGGNSLLSALLFGAIISLITLFAIKQIN